MSRLADVVIVGGGVTGLCTAICLKQLGVERVIILEKYYVGAGQSGRAAGIVRALVPHEKVATWQLQAQVFFKDFFNRFGIPLQVNQWGYLLRSSFQNEDRVALAIGVANRIGSQAKRINLAEAADLQPGLRLDAESIYAFEPGAIQIDPMPATFALACAARQLGVEIIEDCAVGDILVEGSSVCGVTSSIGRFEAPRLMIASGAWGAQQLSKIGVNLPIYPHRAEMAFFHAPLVGGETLCRIVSDGITQLYLRPEGRKQMFVGWREGDFIDNLSGIVRENPDDYKQIIAPARLADMQHRLVSTLPYMKSGFIHRTYTCIYDYSQDGQPVLDEVDKLKGLFFALGFSGGGFSVAPCVGHAMAEYITTGLRPASIKWLSLSRFSEGRSIQWSNSNREIKL